MSSKSNRPLFILEELASGVSLRQIIRDELLEAKFSLDSAYCYTGHEPPDILNRIEKLNTLLNSMNNPESIKIIDRFYQAINMLIENGSLKSKRSFALAHGIEYTSFSRCENEQESDRFQLVWITYLVKEFPINVEWIMTGEGGMFTRHGSN